MQVLVFYGSIALFMLLYVMRALLMSGYDNQNVKHNQRTGSSIVKGWIRKMLRLTPILQLKLTPRSIDHKVHVRFQRIASFYYYGIWACLFVILLLAAKIYLGLFS